MIGKNRRIIATGARSRPVVCVQGLGFVGSAMAVAVATARTKGRLVFDVVGVDLPTPSGRSRVSAINRGEFPFSTEDNRLLKATREAAGRNLKAVDDPEVFREADVVLVDVHCDVRIVGGEPRAELRPLKLAVKTLGERIRPGTLVIVETTVPPGTCERVILPSLRAAFRRRGLPESGVRLAHSYERVMPGDDYFNSIVNFWRVFAGCDDRSASACESFLSKVINTRKFPLTRLSNPTSSETAKIIENSYRATTIAFIEEWARFGEQAGLDLFEILAAIRRRPTHSNIRQPGFGVGGYCLTKDPLLGRAAATQILGLVGVDFPLSRKSVEINLRMPLATVAGVRALLNGRLRGKKILLLGVSYRPGVGDTRYSPSEAFVRALEAEGASVQCHDPLVRFWQERGQKIPANIPDPSGFDAVVLGVAHPQYLALDLPVWLGRSRAVFFDATGQVPAAQRRLLRKAGNATASIGRGANHG